ncbi:MULTISPECIES: hypothetical protein [unclassified Ruegeria]|uniref:hypothetical protein n=1 Tax=unclassified Ruegeria TaxID=2625375 RepID=UPI0014930AAE|nr:MULTISPECIES: hypothetical protein [unclassified Ruegeria]NOD33158.1 hypothetical protein [Ruegeria sp. HKCCD7296]NOE41614.1 hypothetical protein [Ruegeria sp. HKCCD7319]
MNKWIGLGALALVAACDVPQATVVTGPDGQSRIEINLSGLTCYQNRCLDINPAARSVRQIGNRTTRIPASIDVSDGYVTPAEFRQMATTASLAGGQGSGNDR